MRKFKAGLTLAEIIVSLGVLSLVSLSIIGMFSKLLSSGDKQSNQAVARSLAEKILARATREGVPAAGIVNEEVSLKSSRTDLANRFQYDVTVETLRPQVPNSPVGPLVRYIVEVRWRPGSDSQHEQGNHFVIADQVVYLGQ